MKQNLFVLLLMALSMSSYAQNPAYKLFREDGKKVKYEKMVAAASVADVVLFGELHNNPIAHWLQLELTTDLFESSEKELVLGAEMFEADNQLIMDEYLNGMYEADKFEAEMRLWGNYKTDYKPLVEFAKENQLLFIATNIPRRYASMV
ncbi:MAG: ChaN family lipoprotein, partial [Bacteroidales bacterium]|nr:ChaN family lipoprotein [Bacteroidales bacterium]